MGNPYSGEWQKINKIANDVNVLNIKIQQLEVQRSNLYAQLSNIPYETDEEGNDVNAGKRNALYAQIESVNGLIDEANQRKQELSSSAYELASNYRQQAEEFREKASKASGASSKFQKLSGYRFGANTASAGADLAQQRTQHYEDYVTILSDLAEAAELAAEGISSAANSQSISERGTFKNPNAIYNGASSVNSKTNNAETESVWSGKEGNSVKSAKDGMASSTLSQLGVSGIPYTNGTPNFDAVSHAKVGTAMAGVGMVAAADAILAKKFGTTGEEIANYRNENGLEWRDDGTGQNANLIPKSISNEYNDGKMNVTEPTPMEALTAYMCAYNYGKSDYGIYSRDPEWQELHKAAFPDYYQKNEEQERLRQNAIRETLKNRGKNVADFSGYTATEAPNGSWFIVGSDANTHERFLDFWSSADENYTFQKCEEIKWIDSRKIEGINVSSSDIENPQGFWGMHFSGNSFEAWENRAQNLNFISSEFAQGKKYEDLWERPELRDCLGTYFNINHSEPVEVIEVEGEDFYEFNGAGRHRVITAQKMGVAIPMKVVGKKKRITE